MNEKERTLGLRIINELITSYTKINIAASVGTSEVTFNDSILTPSWLVDMKQELILGKYITLTDVIERIKVTLVDRLREMGPYLIALCRILLHEQILQYEVQKLPRALKNACKANDQENKNNKKSTKMTMKRRGDKKFYTIQSSLLNSAITEGVYHDSKFYNTSAKVTEKAASNPVKANENKAEASKSRKMSTRKSALKQDNVPTDSQTSTSSRNSKHQPSKKKTISPEIEPENKAVNKKTAAAASNTSQNNETKNEDQAGRGRPTTRLRQLLTLASHTGQKNTLKTAKKTGKTKLGKRKLPQSENKETTDSQSNTTETVSKTGECSFMAEGQLSIKLKRMTCKDISHHLQNLKGKKKPLSKPPVGLATQSDVRRDQTENSNMNTSTTTPELQASTPIKDQSNSVAVSGLYIQPRFVMSIMERSVEDTLAENIHDDVGATVKNDLAVETTMLLDTAGNHSLAVINKEGEVALTRQAQRKKHSSKFQQKGNQLMGIEEEEIPELYSQIDKELTNTNGKSTQEVTVEGEFNEIDPKSADLTILEHEPIQENITRKHMSISKSLRHQTERTNTNLPTEEILSLDNSLSDGKVGDDEPEVLRVVTKETYRNIKRRILGLFDKIDGKDSEITVEKVIINETIPDDDEQDKQSTESLVQKDILNEGEDDIQFTRSLVQKESTEATNTNHRKGKSLLHKKASSSSTRSGRITKKKTTAKKRMVRVLLKKGVESTHRSLLIEENQLMSPAGESDGDDCMNISGITIDDNMRRLAEEWLNTELMPSEISFEALIQNDGVPEISCFLHACQKALRLPFFTHFEFELSLIIPHASCLMATVITALLSGVPSSKETKMCSPLPYLQWNRKLTARISHWYFIYQRIKHDTKVQELIGLEPIFWKILGSNRNPLSLKPFHQLPIHQRVVILKGLCDHLFHVSKRIQTALISTPRGGREGNWLGEDSQGLKYFHIPIFLREYVGDLRVYCVDYSKLFSSPKEKSFQETDACNTSQDTKDLTHMENYLKKESKNETGVEISYENHNMDKTFSLVADNVEKLNTLVATICTPFAEDELLEAEKKLGQKVLKVEEEVTNQELIKTEDGDDSSVEAPLDVEGTDSRNEHLLLAVNLKSLAKSLNPKEDVLKKSRSASLVKLHMEWMEFNKDGFTIEEKSIASDEKHQKRRNEKRLQMERNDQQDDTFDEPSNIKSGQQPLPRRESLSRRAKSNAGCLSQEGDTEISRKEIVAEMEERALVGNNNFSEEESKWDTSLWADEDSDDDARHEDLIVEDSIWYGYATIQKEATQMEKHPPTRLRDVTSDCTVTKQDSSITKTYTRKGSLTSQKKQMTDEFSSKNDIKIGKPVVITDKASADTQDEIKFLGEKFNGKRLNSYRIKIRKDHLDYFLDKNKPEFLIDLVRKNIAQHNKMNSIPEASMISCGQNQPSNSNSTITLDEGSRLPHKNANVFEVQEINTSHSLTKKILNSFKRRKLQSKCDSLNLTTGESTSDSLKSAPLKVIQLKLPTKDADGKPQLYTKKQLEKVSTFVHKAVQEMNKHGISTMPKATTKETMGHNDNETGITCIKSEDDMEIMISALNHDSELGQLTGMNGAPEIENITEDLHKEHTISKYPSLGNSAIYGVENSLNDVRHKSQTSGFKPFPLKSLNSKNIDIQD